MSDAISADVPGDQTAALRHVELAEMSAGGMEGGVSPAGVLPAGISPAGVSSVGVIGGGTMGSGIAMAFAGRGVRVVLVETDQDAADRAFARIESNYAGSVRRGSMSAEAKAETLALIVPAVDYAALADADLVIEAAFEEMDVKREIFGRLARTAKPSAVLATNTSYLDVDAIGEASGVPQRVVGMHFFSPANLMKLVEVVRGAQTDPKVLSTVVAAARMLGKIPVVVGNCHGFVGNRMLARRSEQVDRLLLEGALPEQVDSVLTGFGFKLGPCATGDLAGLDISWRMRRATGRTAPVADAFVEAGRLGRKTGKGYFRYEGDGRTPEPDPEAVALVESISSQLGIKRRPIEASEILDRLLLPMVNEGARILEDGIVVRSSDIDVIWIHGYGFPRGRGGPMYYAMARGLPDVVARLDELAIQTRDESLRPTRLLRELARDDKAFP